MESGSDEEFYDTTEDFACNRSSSNIALPTKQTSLPECQVAFQTDDSDENKTELKALILDDQESLKSECDKMIIKDSEISRLQTGHNGSSPQEDITNNVSADTENDNISKNSPQLNNDIVNDQTLTEDFQKVEIEKQQQYVADVKELQKDDISDNTPTPVAPPRRRRKQKKGEKQRENVNVEETQETTVTVAETAGRQENAPCIKVCTSTNEMSQVLKSGNSLDVVFNNDLLINKSGGLSQSTPGSPAINKATSTLMRCTSISGRPLTDEEILEQVNIKNLDTGESMPLSLADEKIAQCTNPLALHIMRLATENESELGHDEEDGHLSDTSSIASAKIQDKRKKLKKFFGKTVQKIRSVADEVTGQGRRMEESESDDEEQLTDDGESIKFKNHRAIKDRLLFRKIKLLQDLSGEHIGAVWTMKFSLCGKLLATAGQDNIVRVWVLKESASNFEEMRLKYSRQPTGRSSPTESMNSSTSAADDDPLVEDLLLARTDQDDEGKGGPFKTAPFVSYHGHTSDVLDLSWSKNYFLLSSSMDKTVRLWHISRQECLCCFQHVDFVTAICFHPRDDRYFLSGSLDGKIRLWNIPEKKVALWNEIDGSGTSLVTAANFCQNGKLAVIGTYDGRCIFYDTERLKYHTQVTVRSSRGKNARGRKISGIEPMPGEDKVLITSNDSRIRLYDLKDHSLSCKYKGLQNESSQIRASFSHDGKVILCGSEDKFVYIWRTHHDVANVRNDRNEYYESFSAHDAVVTAAIFAPYPTVIVEKPASNEGESTSKDHQKPFEVLVAADWEGGVKLYVNR